MDTGKHGTAEHAHTTAWIASVLRSRIAAGELTPGSKLSEQSLSASLGVSRNTLRQAFTILAGESIVTHIPNRGVFVASPGEEEVREIYRIRRTIEPAAVLWGELTPQTLDEMEAIVQRAQAARNAGSVTDMADANQALHRAVVGLTGSATLQELMDRVLAEMRLVFHAMASAPDFHSHYVERNVELVKRLRAGEREEAATGLRAYLDAAEAELLGHLAGTGH
ncbi:GntR family transcriptional regulator [Arthrobacter nitrophenolicus]|uniref:GntR family transcriptional regulator n=1 Tax=Arthrobacter nitrophenolicus TaxID=683150 RepID=A0A4R5Y0Y0_9MICC|nr:GntR family transcriptional regulator [Arthrobacter nitrophenolicus]TDL38010.1 GntR family transcriptional regulator [Arthrobacter nitrophenolicus]